MTQVVIHWLLVEHVHASLSSLFRMRSVDDDGRLREPNKPSVARGGLELAGSRTSHSFPAQFGPPDKSRQRFQSVHPTCAANTLLGHSAKDSILNTSILGKDTAYFIHVKQR